MTIDDVPSATPQQWIGRTATGIALARAETDGQLSVDFPAQQRFRVPYPPVPVTSPPTVDGTVLVPVTSIPSTMDSWAGWYESGDRRILLSQIPESYFGEPMVLVGEQDRIMRAYPIGDDRLLADDGTELSLRGNELILSRDGQTVAIGRSTRFREEPVAFTVNDARLAATVIVPTTPGPHPAAVLVHGAAGGQRDFCRLQAQPLLDAGIAVLIYDKAGHGQSGGTEPSIFDQAAAADAGLSALAAHPDIDAGRLGLAGLSNGMWAVPMVAARRPDVTFVTGIGSPGVSMAASEVHRRTKILRDCGLSESTIAAVADAWTCIFAIAGSGETTLVDRLAGALATIQQADDLDRYDVPEYVHQNPMLSSLPPLMPAAELAAMLAAEPDAELGYDPATDYARITCPVFLQYGANDTSVPVAASVAAIEQAAAGPVTIRVYPGLEHILNIVPNLTGLSAEESMYSFHSFQCGPDVRPDLIDWLRLAHSARR